MCRQIFQKEFISRIKNKRVALVGPAPSVSGSGAGPWIDSFDLVARVNMGVFDIASLPHDVGTRTDILYGNRFVQKRLSYDEEIIAKFSPWFSDTLFCFKGHSCLKKSHFSPTAKKLGLSSFRIVKKDLLLSNPNMGFLAIKDLLKAKPKLLHLTGFTFYQGKEVYHGKYLGGHDNKIHQGQNRMFSKFCRIYRKSSNLSVDPTLKAMIEKTKN
ncbi:hypothetical protein CHISP_1430 [Chitinispirillum alkaliphilum]|nr:hypothetical protein CHISP_1430 [Chitinispirillum alkaliphilum]